MTCSKVHSSDMEPSRLTAISPVDGRYWNDVSSLSNLPLPELEGFPKGKYPFLRGIYEKFNEEKAICIKEIEKVTNHDVKAVEYFLKECLDAERLEQFREFVHFGLTSQDVNNTAIPLAIKDMLHAVYLPSLKELIELLESLGRKWIEVPMLARTHGQPATPTRVGKELLVFVERLGKQVGQFGSIPCTGKLGGATGCLNAHHVAYPSIKWVEVADRFLERIGLSRQHYTTQIEHYDDLAARFDLVKRMNTIMLDLSRDMWGYISLDYFRQIVKEGEVGSSTMPHKVNPIDFENAEGNLGVANALLEHFSTKLPISRFQRDLSDSTVLRNIGVSFCHCLLGIKSLKKGFGRLRLNEDALRADLNRNWAVTAEAIQTILRREGFKNPYEALKKLTRISAGNITASDIQSFVESLEVNEEVKRTLLCISPMNYIGVVPDD